MAFAIVVSQFNQTITESLLQGAVATLMENGIAKCDITIVKVPGAIEIPLTAKLLAKKKKYQAIICLGAVIRGETSHYDYVCQQVSQGCQRIMLDEEIPVIFGVLTTNTFAEATARIGGAEGHKGADAAKTALYMVDLLASLSSA